MTCQKICFRGLIGVSQYVLQNEPAGILLFSHSDARCDLFRFECSRRESTGSNRPLQKRERTGKEYSCLAFV